MTIVEIRYQPEKVSAPGATLADLLDERNMSQTELAQHMGRPVDEIEEIVDGRRAITPETALQLERALGVPAVYWRKHEAAYRTYLGPQQDEAPGEIAPP